MVAAAVRAPPGALPDGVDDSKRLSAAHRERLAERLRGDDRTAVATVAVEPARVDDPETDMNSLTVAAHADALGEVLPAESESGPDVILDGADVDPARFARRVGDAVRAEGVDLSRAGTRAEHGADEAHPVVGAASVVAKVERDRRVAAIDAAHDRPVGSGYPSDPTTRAFLRAYVREHGELPPAARESWSTCQDALAAAEQSGLEEF
ncbi:ribonuclease HII [Halobacteriales archaeon SW_7_71_33]|nr:MAG: ribonuclease HII [Halobacteriales archaeon SW_7_71_33]